MQQKLIKIYLFYSLSFILAAHETVIDKRFIIRSCAWQFMQFSRLDFFIKIVSFVNAMRDNFARALFRIATNLNFLLLLLGVCE